MSIYSIVIKGAREKHIGAISALTRGINLRYRPPEEIASHLSNFLVAMDEKGKVVGCVGSKLYDFNMEIISLRIIEEYVNKGLGKMLLKHKLEELKEWPKLNVFALTTKTLADKLFFPLGFIEVGIQLFGSKVLTDCLGCSKNRLEGRQHLCNEIAVLYLR